MMKREVRNMATEVAGVSWGTHVESRGCWHTMNGSSLDDGSNNHDGRTNKDTHATSEAVTDHADEWRGHDTSKRKDG